MSAAEERVALLAEHRLVDDEIQALYWFFTRQARAKPPAVVAPGLYRRRHEIEQRLAELRSLGA